MREAQFCHVVAICKNVTLITLLIMALAAPLCAQTESDKKSPPQDLSNQSSRSTSCSTLKHRKKGDVNICVFLDSTQHLLAGVYRHNHLLYGFPSHYANQWLVSSEPKIFIKDLNNDKLADIVIIASCYTGIGPEAAVEFPVGSIFFQSPETGWFYNSPDFDEKVSQTNISEKTIQDWADKNAKLITDFLGFVGK